jgi:dCTP deaminase
MSLVLDTDLRREISANPPNLVVGVKSSNLQTQIHGCAVELRIGGIFRPGTEPNKAGSASKPRRDIVLKEGETAVLQTLESFDLDDSHTALVFPISSVCLKGLLMTNPGHVDPGYKGQLHVTVINMGREPYPLKSGDRLLRALIFKLTSNVSTTAGSANPLEDDVLDRLSPDFLSVNARVADAAKREIDAAIRMNGWLQYGLPALAAILGAIVSGYWTNLSNAKDFERRIAAIESQGAKVNADVRLLKLEADFPTQDRLETLENKVSEMSKKVSK